MFAHVGGKLTESLSVVDLWLFFRWYDGVDKRLVDLLRPSGDDRVDGWVIVDRREIFLHVGPNPVHDRSSVIIGRRKITVPFMFCGESGDCGNRS